jgi:ParB-like chromosome segregation protein Spo0J
MKTLFNILRELKDENTFTHNSRVYSLGKLNTLVKENPISTIKISELDWIFKYDNPLEDEPERILTANIKQPILITKSQGKWVVLDGLHRIAHAKIKKVSVLPCKVVSKDQLKLCAV